MKINKVTSALIAMGIVSLAGAAHANTVIYLTGSTAFRATIYNAATQANGIFTSAGTVVSGNNASGASTIVYEGNITGLGTVDIDCSWSGSEAGIAAVAGRSVSQILSSPDDPNASAGGTSYPLPNVTPSFLTQASGWTTLSTLPIAGGVSTPDLAMADTSQTVSLTPPSVYAEHNFATVGIIPFTFAKGYEATADSAWTDCNNITTAAINQALSVGFALNANIITGVAGDAADGVAVMGRNIGSGTHANTLLNAAQYGLNTPLQQYAWGPDTVAATGVLYPTTVPAGSASGGTLTFVGSYAANQAMSPVGNDGFDSGGSVQKSLNVDGTGSGFLVIGYLGVPDAQAAINNTAGGPATPLAYNGVYESDTAIENGTYTYWGQEHLYGQSSPSTTDTTVGTAMAAGIENWLSHNAGTATGTIVNNAAGQSGAIPSSLMNVYRGTDSGFPEQE